MFTNKEIEKYIARLGFHHKLDVDFLTLKRLHIAHMKNIPFENLDICLGNKINLSTPALFRKIILQCRGGFCYELNYLFSTLLISLGFKVSLLAARVFNDGAYGKPFDHLLLLVELNKEKVIADVGFGDSFVEPLSLYGVPMEQNKKFYCVKREASDYILLNKKTDGSKWCPQYVFSLRACDITSFYEMCEYRQTSDESPFTRKLICSIATNTGRKTISNNRYIETTGKIRKEYPISDNIRFFRLLKEYFKIVLHEDVNLNYLE